MCLIIHKPAGIAVPRDVIASALEMNADGFGLMAANGKTLRAVGASVADCVKAIASVHDVEAAIHWRWATQGSKTRDNAHPFRAHGHYIMHNGHINGFKCKDGKASDTRLWVEKWFAPRVAGGHHIELKAIEKEIGYSNAVVIMRPDKKIEIANKWRGTDYAGLWFSNTYAWDAPRELLPQKYVSNGQKNWLTAYESASDASAEIFLNSAREFTASDDTREEVIAAISELLPTDFGPADCMALEPMRGASAGDFHLFKRFSESRLGLWEYLEKVSARTLVCILRDLW